MGSVSASHTRKTALSGYGVMEKRARRNMDMHIIMPIIPIIMP